MKEYNSGILTRIAADLQKELSRTTNEVVKQDLEDQIDALKSFKNEIDSFRMVKNLLK